MVGVISCPSCNSNVSIGNTSCWKCGHAFATSDRQIAYQKANGFGLIFGLNGRLNRKGFLLQEGISFIFLFASLIMAIISAAEFIWLGIGSALRYYSVCFCASSTRLRPVRLGSIVVSDGDWWVVGFLVRYQTRGWNA